MAIEARGTRNHRWTYALLSCVALAGVLAGACSGDEALPELNGPVEIIVDPDDVERWEALGPLVEAGHLCPSGRRQVVAFSNPDTGEEVGLVTYERLVDSATFPGERPDLLVLIDHVCDDGSGTVLAAENQHRHEWDIVSGTGRYVDATGSGSVSFVAESPVQPSEVYIAAVMAIAPHP